MVDITTLSIVIPLSEFTVRDLKIESVLVKVIPLWSARDWRVTPPVIFAKLVKFKPSTVMSPVRLLPIVRSTPYNLVSSSSDRL